MSLATLTQQDTREKLVSAGILASLLPVSGIWDLSGVSLANVTIPNAEFGQTNFRRANLRGAEFPGANFFEANFTGACLIDVDFSVTDIYGAIFDGANLAGADFTGVKGVTPIQFINSIGLERATLDPGRFSDAVAAGYRLPTKEVNFSRILLKGEELNALLDKGVDSLPINDPTKYWKGLRARILKILLKNNICFIGQLVQYLDLANVPGLGDVNSISRKALLEALTKVGLRLGLNKEEIEYWNPPIY